VEAEAKQLNLKTGVAQFGAAMVDRFVMFVMVVEADVPELLTTG
jgi:hypothetical protein